MIWEAQKNSRVSHLVGTAHFFPYSFRNSLQRCLKNARVVMFEGPLDDQNMDRVRAAGTEKESAYHIFDELDEKTISRWRRACGTKRIHIGMDETHDLGRGRYLDRHGYRHGFQSTWPARAVH